MADHKPDIAPCDPVTRQVILDEHDLGSGLQHQFGSVGIREFRKVITLGSSPPSGWVQGEKE